MTDDAAHPLSLNARVQAMAHALASAQHAADAPTSAEARETLKRQIIALFREADSALQQAQATKDAVKQLAEQWKQLDQQSPAPVARVSPVPQASGITARVDHLGASTFIEKGWSRLSLLDAAGAEVAFRRALELAPGSSEGEALLAWAIMLQERYDEAQSWVHRVLARDPHHALAHTNRGYLELRRGAYGDAIETLSAVIRDDVDRRAVLYAHLYLGMVYREREMFDDAEGFFRKALELGPNLLQSWYEMGRGYWFAGRRDDARLAWKTGSEANKFSPWGKRCADVLHTVEQGGDPPRVG